MYFWLNLRQFDTPINGTYSNSQGNDLSAEMRTFYDETLIDEAEPNLVHDQFAQKKPIPRNSGKTIQFRKYTPLQKATKPLTEGVTPEGNKLNVTTLEATVDQYGDFIVITDMLDLTAVDNNIVEATKLLGSQAGRTLDTITREVLNGGTSVQYADGSVTSRAAITSAKKLTVDCVKRAIRYLKTQNTPPLEGGYYAGIVHPDTEYDLTSDSAWVEANKYTDPDHEWISEIGRIGKVRFVLSTEAKIFAADDLASDSRNLAVNGAVSANATTLVFDGGTVAENALKGRKILVDGNVYTVKSNTASSGTATITLETGEKFAAISDNTVIYPGEAGAAGIPIYSTMIMGANAYGTTKIDGGGLQTIIKQLGSSGVADPLNQRASVGWKATKTAERLVENYMIRVETASTFQSDAN